MTNKAISPVRRRLIEDMAIRRLPQDSVPVYPPRQKVCRLPRPVCRQGHRRGCPSLSVVAGLDRNVGGNRQRQRHCPAVLLQGHPEAPRSCRGAHLDPRASPPSRCSQSGRGARLLALTTNIKHRAILSLAYATGLRASEGRIAQAHRYRSCADAHPGRARQGQEGSVRHSLAHPSRDIA